MTSTAIEVLVSTDCREVDTLVRSVAAKIFIEQQGHNAEVGIVLESEFLDSSSYSPIVDLHFLQYGRDADQITRDFRFSLFEKRFVEPFCSGLLFSDCNASRSELDENWRALVQLARTARDGKEDCESMFVQSMHRRNFLTFADDLIDLTHEMICKRILIPTNETFAVELFSDFLQYPSEQASQRS